MPPGGPPPPDVARVVALGASNLTRGFQTVVATARAAWGPRVQVVAALGHGRSYGADSLFLARRMPGILDCGLWPQLEAMPPAPTRGLVTDVGNDVLYGFPASRILGWVDEALARLQRFTNDIVLTDLPLVSVGHLSRPKFYTFRSVFAPSCRMSIEQIVDVAARVNEGLAELAAARGARFLRLKPSWYGFDPIHIRPAMWRTAWQEILGIACETRRSRAEALALYFMLPELQWLCGIEQRTPQAGVTLRRGGQVWLY